MTVVLTKGQKINLNKADGSGLTRVRMGLGWDPVPTRGLLGRSRKKDIDLDASCLMLDAVGQLVDQVWWRQLRSKCGSVTHTGDNLTGHGDGDDESIKVDLNRVPPHVNTLVFTVNSFTGQDFSEVANAGCRLVDESGRPENEIANFHLTGSGNHTALVMTKLYRHNGAWKMSAIGAPAHGRTFHDLMPTVAASV